MRTPLAVLFFVAIQALAAAPVAVLGGLEGEVTVDRGTVVLGSDRVNEGLALEAFDLVRTGAGGRAEVRFPAGVGVSAVVRLDPFTAVCLDLTSLRQDQTVGLEVLTGGLTAEVAAVTGSSVLELRTGSGAAAGTVGRFRLVLSASGDALVTSAAGRVACRTPGLTVSAEPGTLVELGRTGPVTYTANPSTQAAFEASWKGLKDQAWGDQAPTWFRTEAAAYQRQAGQVQRAWDRWQRDLKDDPQGGSWALAALRQIGFEFQRTSLRVASLRALADRGLIPATLEVNRGYPAKDFFRQAQNDDALWLPRWSAALGAYKALAERLGGRVPSAADGSAVTYDSAFFR